MFDNALKLENIKNMKYRVYIDIKFNHKTNLMVFFFLSISKTITDFTDVINNTDLTII